MPSSRYPPSSNRNDLTLRVVQGDDEDDDADRPDVKYNKKRRKRRRESSSCQGVPVILGLWIMFGSIFAVWQYTAHRLEVKARQERLERQARSERIWKERHYDAPHFGNNYRPEGRLEHAFAEERKHLKETGELSLVRKILKEWLEDLNQEILHNVHYGGPRWIRPYLLPPLPDSSLAGKEHELSKRRPEGNRLSESVFFKVDRQEAHMTWLDEWNAMSPEQQEHGPPVDYTVRDKYHYPEVQHAPPPHGYPAVVSLEEIMREWHQDQDNEGIIVETLLHFNYSDPDQLSAAKQFRDAGLPFKLYDIPEIDQAGLKWTDEYLADNFAAPHDGGRGRRRNNQGVPLASGVAQESPNNYFAFFVPKMWNIDTMGLPPTRNNDWTFAQWAQHARYADAVALEADQPHYYWQSGVPPEERHRPSQGWTFISRDLPSMGSLNETFFLFHPEEQKGMQCRFGERGVVAATHFDGGRNMIAMITGAKRYILSPPNQCSKLGIFTSKKSPIYRHSLLNFGHILHLSQQDHIRKDTKDGMSPEERAWLERAATAQAVETVLKAGEVLYIPSHWFHYIISLQKSAQCNVRSGIDKVGTVEFGGFRHVEECKD